MTAPNNRERILPRLIDEEIKESFINYSMSVIVSRALPDVRDGLKPVHRRDAVRDERARARCRAARTRSPRRSSATCSASTTRTATARCTTRSCAWCRSSRCAIRSIDGQGNFGSVDGDPAGRVSVHRSAAHARSRWSCWPTSTRTPSTSRRTSTTASRSRRFFPAGIPNLLVNGSSGIAVGMATNIPPHNLQAKSSARRSRMIDNPELDDRRHPEDRQGPRLPDGRATSTAARASRTIRRRAAARSSCARAP